jgi:hypothetical protein
MHKQQTIKKECSYKGIGLHTGNTSSVRFLPAAPDSDTRMLKEVAAKEAEFKANWQSATQKRDERRLGVAQRLTRMYSKARAAVNKAGWDVYHAQLDAKKNGWEPVKQAEERAAKAEARMKHIEGRAKKLRVDPKRTYKATHDLLW